VRSNAQIREMRLLRKHAFRKAMDFLFTVHRLGVNGNKMDLNLSWKIAGRHTDDDTHYTEED